MSNNRYTKPILILLAAALIVFGIVALAEDEPDTIGEHFEEMGDEVEDAGDELQDGLEDAADELKQAGGS